MTSRVYMLGAGFSKAASENVSSADDRMPLLWELREPVERLLKAAGVPDAPYLASNFIDEKGNADVERWLSFLASPPPWLSASGAMRCRASFLDVTKAISEVVRSRQQNVFGQGVVDWLPSLVKFWNAEQSPGFWDADPAPVRPAGVTTVVTFNYDNIVERAYMELSFDGAHTYPRNSACDLLMAPLIPLESLDMSVVTSRGYAAFQLLKLHGSVDWYYSGTDASPSDSVYYNRVQHRWHEPDAEADKRFQSLVSDKVPLIVPPVATKDAVYSNAMLRAQWVEASKALDTADEIVFMGFSLPPTDLVVRDMVSVALKRNSSASLVVVDQNGSLPDGLAKILDLDSSRIHSCYAGRSAGIRDWVNERGRCLCR